MIPQYRYWIFLHQCKGRKNWTQIVIDSISIVIQITSVILVLCTLREMQEQRNNAYLPDIVFEPVQVDVSWGNQDNLKNPIANSEVNSSIKIISRNIGVGVAKKVAYSLNIDYIQCLKMLDILNSDNNYSYHIEGDFFNVYIDNHFLFAFSIHNRTDKVFLLPNAEEKYEISLPPSYVLFLQEVARIKDLRPIHIPDIKIIVSFSDIQGIQYQNEVYLAVSVAFFLEDKEGNGVSSFKISMK
jgi:hypothetical protein